MPANETASRIKVVNGIELMIFNVDGKRPDTHERTCVTLRCVTAPH